MTDENTPRELFMKQHVHRYVFTHKKYIERDEWFFFVHAKHFHEESVVYLNIAHTNEVVYGPMVYCC